MTFNELPELRQGCKNRAAPATYNVLVVRWDVWINDRLRGTFRTGEFFGHRISYQSPFRSGRLVTALASQRTDKAVSRFHRRRGSPRGHGCFKMFATNPVVGQALMCETAHIRGFLSSQNQTQAKFPTEIS